MGLKKFNKFKSTKVDEAFSIITESIGDFMSKDSPSNVDSDELNKIQKDVLSKYDLPKSDIDNIKSRISDAISKKMSPNMDINTDIKKD